MKSYVVKVKKHGKWKFYSDHEQLDYAEINAQVQELIGLETKIEHEGQLIERKGKKQ